MAELSTETVETVPTAMAGESEQTGELLIAALQREARRRAKSQLQSSLKVVEKDEMAKRKIAAATEWYMRRDDAKPPSFRQLADKHGLTFHTDVSRQVKKMKHLSDNFRLAREFEADAGTESEQDPETTATIGAAADEGCSSATAERGNYLGSGQSQMLYRRAMAHACTLIGKKGLGPAEAAKAAGEKFECTLNKATVKKHYQRHGSKEPVTRGRPLNVSAEDEERMVNVVMLMRMMKLPTERGVLKSVFEGMFRGGRYESLFPHGVTESWYTRFMSRHSDKLETGTKRKHEIARERWATSNNLQTFYDVLEGVLLTTGIAVLNPNYVEGARWNKQAKESENEKACKLIIVKPDRLASCDETEVTTNMSQGSSMGKTKGERIVKIKTPKGQATVDSGETLSNKSSNKTSMYGGSFATGKSLRPCVVWSVKPKAGWMMNAPRSTVVAHNGQRHTCTQTWNSHGGATPETFLQFLKSNFVTEKDEDGTVLIEHGCVAKATPGEPVVLLIDGHDSHCLDDSILEFCREHGIHLVLRPPHCSHIVQGEDVINYRHLKCRIRQSVGSLLAVRAVSAMRKRGGQVKDVSVGSADLMNCVKDPWEEAFAESKCLKGWRLTGIVPFSRCVYWQLKDTEAQKQAHSDLTNSQTGLNLENFTLNNILGDTAPTFTPEQMQMVDPDEEMTLEERLQECEAIVNTRMNSSQLWSLDGGLTGDLAFEKVAIWRRKKRQEAATKEQAARQKHQEQHERRMAAHSSIDALKALVGDKGWVTGARGIKKEMLAQVILFCTGSNPKHTEKVPELVAKVKELLKWDEGTNSFSGDLSAQPPAPPADEIARSSTTHSCNVPAPPPPTRV